MNTIEWLSAQRPGFGQLDPYEKTALVDFMLMWTYFEATALKCDASHDRIRRFSKNLAGEKKLDETKLEGPLRYFSERYFQEGKPTFHFQFLRLMPKPSALVEGVLSGKQKLPEERLTAALHIAYRFRNNLFHGPKWEYDIRDQRGNFECATEVLRASIEMMQDNLTY